MIEVPSTNNRLVVILPDRDRIYGRGYLLFVDGKSVERYRTFGEAYRHAKEVAGTAEPGDTHDDERTGG